MHGVCVHCVVVVLQHAMCVFLMMAHTTCLWLLHCNKWLHISRDVQSSALADSLLEMAHSFAEPHTVGGFIRLL